MLVTQSKILYDENGKIFGTFISSGFEEAKHDPNLFSIDVGNSINDPQIINAALANPTKYKIKDGKIKLLRAVKNSDIPSS